MTKSEFQIASGTARDLTCATLLERYGARATANPTVRRQHANSLALGRCEPADVVVYPTTEAEIVDIVKLCADQRMPIIPFGTGTSFEGQTNAPYGGVCIDTSQMTKIISTHTEDQDCVVEPGVTRKQLNAHLRDTGLFFPVDPGADASIGGMVATRASGTNAVRYGTMKDSVLSLRAVLPDGSVIRSASRARKSSAGYDLTRLFVGSEGTLGLISEVTLKLQAIPVAISAGICSFPTVRHACDAAIAASQSGLTFGRIELLDGALVRACNSYSNLALPPQPLLLFEFSGSETMVTEQAEAFGAIATESRGTGIKWTTRSEERARLWQARHDAFHAAQALRPGATTITTDVCVPLSRLADCVELTSNELRSAAFTAVIGGHIGDGNFHVTLLIDPGNAAEIDAVHAFSDALVKRAIEMDGTCTGEHGIGQNKARYLKSEFGSSGLSVMRAIKSAIDPFAIMNPGKIFPD